MRTWNHCICGRESCQFAYANRKGRTNHCGHSFHVSRKKARGRDWELMALQRREKATKGASGVKDKSFQKDFPNLHDFLTAEKWPDGVGRSPGTLLIFAQDGVWKAMLNDKDQGIVAFKSAATYADLLCAVEEIADGSTGEWRPSTMAKGKKKKD